MHNALSLLTPIVVASSTGVTPALPARWHTAVAGARWEVEINPHGLWDTCSLFESALIRLLPNFTFDSETKVSLRAVLKLHYMAEALERRPGSLWHARGGN